MSSGEPPGGTDSPEAATGSSGKRGVPITRRRAIVGGGLTVLLGAGVGVSHVLRPARAASPSVPVQDLEDNGWVQVAETTETVLDGEVGPVEATAIATTVRYDDRGLAGQIQDTPVTVEYRGQTTTGTLCDYFDDGFDQSLSVFAATKIDLSPHIDELPGGIGRAEVMEPVETQAQSQFERQLGDAGLKNVTRVSTGTIEVASGLKASLFEYRASFPLERTRVSVLDGTIDVPADEIEIAGYLAIWHDGRNVLIGAGAHPNENHQDTVTDAVQGSEVTVSYDIDLSPARLRQEVLGYLRRIE